MSSGYRARFGLLAVALLALPLASGQSAVPVLPDPQATPTVPIDPTGPLSIRDGGLTFEGPAHNPTRVVVVGADGTRALEYQVDGEGRARLDVAGENALADATLLRVEGDPTGNAFTLVLRDPQGGLHRVLIDRNALATMPSEVPVGALPPAPVTLVRPPSWPGAPERSYLVHISDSAKNHLNGNALDGSRFLQRSGGHKATMQIPLAEKEWDRWLVQARRGDLAAPLNATFEVSHETRDAIVLVASYSPSALSPLDGDTIAVKVIFEKRLSPLVTQRFDDVATYRYKLDGTGPTVDLVAPATADDFRFTVRWSGADALTGIGQYRLDYREAGAAQYRHWITTDATSAVFSGEWGTTYEFRARSYDRVGNPSGDDIASTVIAAQPTGVDDVNDAPTARLLTPAAGSTLAGLVSITWAAGDPDGTETTSRLELSDDDGASWRLLYVGTGKSATWDTTQDVDGPGYRIRLTLSDGTQSASDVASALRVRNIVAPAALAPAEGAEPTSSTPKSPVWAGEAAQYGDEPASDAAPAAAEEGARGVPGPAAPLVALALGGIALLARRRRA